MRFSLVAIFAIVAAVVSASPVPEDVVRPSNDFDTVFTLLTQAHSLFTLGCSLPYRCGGQRMVPDSRQLRRLLKDLPDLRALVDDQRSLITLCVVAF